MANYVALLRGINVGGNNILPMQAFRDLLSGLGAENISTYIQSGNAVFRHSATASKLSALIADEIEKRFEFRPPVMMLTDTEYSDVVSANPFSAHVDEPTSLSVWFLGKPAADANLERMNEIAVVGEEFELSNAALYLYAPNGLGRSKLAAGIEKCLGVEVTARNWRTVGKISDLLAKLS